MTREDYEKHYIVVSRSLVSSNYITSKIAHEAEL